MQDFKTHGHYNKVKAQIQNAACQTNNLYAISLPSINLLHLMVSEILPGQNFKGQGHYCLQ